MKRSKKLSLGLACLLSLGPAHAAPAGPPAGPRIGTLTVTVSGCKHGSGQVVLKLYRQDDDVPRGRGYREARVGIRRQQASAQFEHLAHGSYALFVFHDENKNNTLDHNLVGLPREPMGFSNGFHVSLFSGIPDFEDLKFTFDSSHARQSITVR